MSSVLHPLTVNLFVPTLYVTHLSPTTAFEEPLPPCGSMVVLASRLGLFASELFLLWANLFIVGQIFFAQRNPVALIIKLPGLFTRKSELLGMHNHSVSTLSASAPITLSCTMQPH